MYCDPMEACDVYTLQCSTLVTAVDLAIMGATWPTGASTPSPPSASSHEPTCRMCWPK